MNNNKLNRILVILLSVFFISVTIQPIIIADDSIESDNSELVEITIEIYEVDKTYNHTVILTQQQAEELEIFINNFEIELDETDNIYETENIFKNTVVSLNELGLLPNSISIEDAQNLVTGKEQNPRIEKFFERYYSKNQKSADNDENILCLISGDTINTIFAGSVPILIFLRCLVFVFRINLFFGWLSNFPELWDKLTPYLGKIVDIFFGSRFSFWFYLAAGINFCPIKFGALMHYGWYDISFDPWYPSERIPAKGWVYTNGLYGKKEWSGDFYGNVLGFTGIKIIRGFLDFYYLGAALKVRIEDT